MDKDNKWGSNGHKKRDNWLDGIFGIGGGISLLIFAWAKRPIDLRDLSETAILTIQKDAFVLKPIFFYGAIFASVALIIYGIVQIRANLNK